MYVSTVYNTMVLPVGLGIHRGLNEKGLKGLMIGSQPVSQPVSLLLGEAMEPLGSGAQEGEVDHSARDFKVSFPVVSVSQ